jgi:hypothetical protein
MANTILYGGRSIGFIPDGSTNFDIATIQGNILELGTIVGTFTVGESVSQATSGATGVVGGWNGLKLVLTQMTGTFDTSHVVTGGSSTAHGIPSTVNYAFANGIRLSAVDFKPSGPGDTLVVRSKTATGSPIFLRADVTGGGIHQAVDGRPLRRMPFVKASEQVWATPASVVVMFQYD